MNGGECYCARPTVLQRMSFTNGAHRLKGLSYWVSQMDNSFLNVRVLRV